MLLTSTIDVKKMELHANLFLSSMHSFLNDASSNTYLTYYTKFA